MELAHADDAASQRHSICARSSNGLRDAATGREETGNIAGLVRSGGDCGRQHRLRPWLFVLSFFFSGYTASICYYLVSIWFIYDGLDLVFTFYLILI